MLDGFHGVVKIETDLYGDKVDDPVWHLSVDFDGCSRALCTGEVYGEGENSVTYHFKQVKKNGVTCDACLHMIKYFKDLNIKI